MIVTTHISAQMELMFASETSHKTSFPFPSCSRQYTKIHNTSEQWIGLYIDIYIYLYLLQIVSFLFTRHAFQSTNDAIIAPLGIPIIIYNSHVSHHTPNSTDSITNSPLSLPWRAIKNTEL